jgi:hypothetical protein
LVARPLRRACIEVAAIRWLIHEDLTAWGAVAPADEPAGHEDDTRTRLRHQARDHKIAYQAISGRLQALQDAAHRTRQKEQADLLGSFRRSLQESHAGLMEILDRPAAGAAADLEGTGQFSIEIEDGEQGTAESVQDVIGRAVGDSAVSGHAAQADPRQAISFWKGHNWWRMASLSGIAALLTVIAVLLQVYHPGDAPPPIEFSPSDATNVIALTDTTSIGTMLYARVSPLWNSLTDRDKLMELSGLARLASDRGFRSVLLVDEAGEPVAEWNQSTGPGLKAPRR